MATVNPGLGCTSHLRADSRLYLGANSVIHQKEEHHQDAAGTSSSKITPRLPKEAVTKALHRFT